MKRILIIRPSSLGDIIQTFPALTDAATRFPEIKFDWAVKSHFFEVPRLHPAVSEVIDVKNYRTHPEHYDAVFELTGLMKNAFFSRFYRADQIFGFSYGCARERLAALFYTRRIHVEMNQPTVLKNKAFFAQALGYSVIPAPGSSPGQALSRDPWIPRQARNDSTKPYWVFLHGTTRVNKQWPEVYWRQLAKQVVEGGFEIKLLWGNDYEHGRALRIASVSNQIWVAPNILAISDLADLLLGAHQVIGLDSGLTHLSSTLGVKTFAIYGSADPKRVASLGTQETHLASNYLCAPCSLRSCKLKHELPDSAPCFVELTPERVLKHL